MLGGQLFSLYRRDNDYSQRRLTFGEYVYWNVLRRTVRAL